MKKIIFSVSLMLFLFSLLNAVNLEKLLLENSLGIHFYSYIGDQYHPHLDKNKHSYQEYSDFRLRWDTDLPQEMNFKLELRTKEELTEVTPYIHNASIRLDLEALTLVLKMDYLELGNNSRIISKNLMDPDYDVPLLQNYRFDGVELRYKLDNVTVFGQAGGNKYHTLISLGGLKYQRKIFKLDLYGIHIGRSSQDNRKTVIAGMNGSIDSKVLYLNLEGNYHRNLEDDYDYYRTLAEFIVKPLKNIEIGANYFYKDLFYEKEVIRGILGFESNRIELSLIQLYSQTELALYNDYLRMSSLIAMYKFNEFFKIGLNFNYLNPNHIEDYYQVGMQFEFAYEMD